MIINYSLLIFNRHSNGFWMQAPHIPIAIQHTHRKHQHNRTTVLPSITQFDLNLKKNERMKHYINYFYVQIFNQ